MAQQLCAVLVLIVLIFTIQIIPSAEATGTARDYLPQPATYYRQATSARRQSIYSQPSVWYRTSDGQLKKRPEIRSIGTAPFIPGHGVAGEIDDNYVPSRAPVHSYQDSNLFEEDTAAATEPQYQYRRVDVPYSASELRNLPALQWKRPETRSLGYADDNDFSYEHMTGDGATIPRKYYKDHRVAAPTGTTGTWRTVSNTPSKTYYPDDKWFTIWPYYKDQLQRKSNTREFVSKTNLVRKYGTTSPNPVRQRHTRSERPQETTTSGRASPVGGIDLKSGDNVQFGKDINWSIYRTRQGLTRIGTKDGEVLVRLVRPLD